MPDEKPQSPETAAEARQRRMADALRANLRRRKDQGREQAGERTASLSGRKQPVSGEGGSR